MAENNGDNYSCPNSLHGTPKHDSNLSSAWKTMRRWPSATIFLFFLTVLVGAFIFWVDLSFIMELPFDGKFLATRKPRRSVEYRLNCSSEAVSNICKANHIFAFEADALPGATCPEYFRWIHEDLRTWKSTGISREMIEGAKDLAHFRLVIYRGKAYLEQYHGAFQTRDLFTIWSFVQLLRFYPGRLPDLELMFRLEDFPIVKKRDYQGPNATAPPVLFQYCGDADSVGIVFPDWSFWGWAEVNVKPWESILQGIVRESKKTKWKNRAPYAFWKGNPSVSGNREDLMKCNLSDKQDWNARLYVQDWERETREGFKHSSLEQQCTHRYKIYIEGVGWSVSEKYIFACDSMVLLVKPRFYDFYSRTLKPLQHYWPIRKENKCRDIKFAVDWGNKHPKKAQEIGKAGSKFMQEELSMKYVYDYMFHLLGEYAKLLTFKPEVPAGAVELCGESMVCSQPEGLVKTFMVESLAKYPSESVPCIMVPPYDPLHLQALIESQEKRRRQVEKWESEYWEKLHKS